ncbi:hypothetical protein COO55_35510 [Rhodococcus opacus]|nr:hypothetical protein COO55_35510 [Rhodococcus opacus]
MIDETIASHTLDGYRHLPIVAREALARFLVWVGDIVAASPRDQRTRLDLNPVIASDTGIVLVDVRIILSKNHPGDHTKLRQGRTFLATEGRGCCRGPSDWPGPARWRSPGRRSTPQPPGTGRHPAARHSGLRTLAVPERLDDLPVPDAHEIHAR